MNRFTSVLLFVADTADADADADEDDDDAVAVGVRGRDEETGGVRAKGDKAIGDRGSDDAVGVDCEEGVEFVLHCGSWRRHGVK